MKKQVDAVDDELDKLDDEFEYAYQMKEISFETYKARERTIEKLEDELELAEEALENKYGIDDEVHIDFFRNRQKQMYLLYEVRVHRVCETFSVNS